MSKRTAIFDHTRKYSEIGYNIAYYRKHAKLTQEQLAEKVGISRSHMSAIEAPNVSRKVSMELVFDFAEVLHIEPYKLIKEHDQ